MNCPICKSKTKTLEAGINNQTEEAYRKRICCGCGYVFYTVEFEITPTKRFKSEWNKVQKINMKLKQKNIRPTDKTMVYINKDV
jgi:transcriptional regulator NrdR family protein